MIALKRHKSVSIAILRDKLHQISTTRITFYYGPNFATRQIVFGHISC